MLASAKKVRTCTQHRTATACSYISKGFSILLQTEWGFSWQEPCYELRQFCPWRSQLPLKKLMFILHKSTVETGCKALLAVKSILFIKCIVLCELYCSLLGTYAQQATWMTSNQLHEPRKKARSRLEEKMSRIMRSGRFLATVVGLSSLDTFFTHAPPTMF